MVLKAAVGLQDCQRSTVVSSLLARVAGSYQWQFLKLTLAKTYRQSDKSDQQHIPSFAVHEIHEGNAGGLQQQHQLGIQLGPRRLKQASSGVLHHLGLHTS